MRQEEYISEKNSYKNPDFIRKQDKKYKKTHPTKYRFHLFVQLEIVFIENNIATVIYKKDEIKIQLQNMDSYFYFSEIRKNKQLEKLENFRPTKI
jgi:hypothetical protein